MVRRLWNRLGHVFETIGRRSTDASENWLSDPFRGFREQLCWAVLIIGGGLGVILLIRYPDYPKQLMIAACGLACLVTAIAGLRARTKPQSIRQTWWALALFAITIALMVLVHNFWPPLFPSLCYGSC
jgi:cell division protein FtsW (lipid II flippase)